MKCVLCMYVGQYLLNFLNLGDHTLNFILLGDANETVSARTARARAAGSSLAAKFCAVLTFLSHVFTFGSFKGDHCTYALNAKILPNSREIWDWNTNTILAAPVTIIDDEEIPNADPQ